MRDHAAVSATTDKPALPLPEMLQNAEAGVSRLLESGHRRDKAQKRQQLVAALRRLLDDGKASARSILEGQKSGLACARRLSAVMDAVMIALYKAA